MIYTRRFKDSDYDYVNAVKQDIINSIEDDEQVDELRKLSYQDRMYEIEEWYWADDNVTGNGGDFYDRADVVAKYVNGNSDYVEEALKEFDGDGKGIIKALHDYGVDGIFQYLDCTARCYAFYEASEKALEELGLGEDVEPIE